MRRSNRRLKALLAPVIAALAAMSSQGTALADTTTGPDGGPITLVNQQFAPGTTTTISVPAADVGGTLAGGFIVTITVGVPALDCTNCSMEPTVWQEQASARMCSSVGCGVWEQDVNELFFFDGIHVWGQPAYNGNYNWAYVDCPYNFNGGTDTVTWCNWWNSPSSWANTSYPYTDAGVDFSTTASYFGYTGSASHWMRLDNYPNGNVALRGA